MISLYRIPAAIVCTLSVYGSPQPVVKVSSSFEGHELTSDEVEGRQPELSELDLPAGVTHAPTVCSAASRHDRNRARRAVWTHQP